MVIIQMTRYAFLASQEKSIKGYSIAQVREIAPTTSQ
jgi:hypothetical protein